MRKQIPGILLAAASLIFTSVVPVVPVAAQTRRRGATARRTSRGRTTRATSSKPVSKSAADSATKTAAKVVPIPGASGAATTASGLTYIVTKRGAGEQLRPGAQVSVHYTGMLTNGVQFDSSRGRGEPITFPLGVGRVIKGWDEGLALLRVGDHATLIIPPQLGYGSRGAGGDIPPDATLIFVVEVVGVEGSPAPAGDVTPPSE